jgi:hypothetical protein
VTRRALLGFFAAAALDPDRLLWRAGAKRVSIPAARPFLAVGDLVIFGDWPDVFAVSAGAASRAGITNARFEPLGSPQYFGGREWRIGDTLQRREKPVFVPYGDGWASRYSMLTLVPENMLRIKSQRSEFPLS